MFDSGVGGLTVLHELLVSLPTEDYVYLGDTARFPYGERSQAELRAFAIEIADHLLGRRRQAAGGRVQRRQLAALGPVDAARRAPAHFDIDVIGVVAPATQLAVAGSRTGGSGCSPPRPRSPAARTSARSARPTRTSTSRAWRARTWRR